MKVCWQSSCNYRPNTKGRRWLSYNKLKIKNGHDNFFLIKRKYFTVRHTQRFKEETTLGFGWAMCKNRKEREEENIWLLENSILHQNRIPNKNLDKILFKRGSCMFFHTRAEFYSRTSEGCTSAWLQLSGSYGIKYKHYTGALQKSWQLGCVLYQVSRELCYQTAVCMKAKSLCFGRVQTKHQENPCTLNSKVYGSRWFGSKCFIFHRRSAKVVTHSSKTDK